MYGHRSTTFPRASDSLGESPPFPPTLAPPPPTLQAHLSPFLHDQLPGGTEFESLHETMRLLSSEVSNNNSCSSGCSSYGSPSSLASHSTQRPSLIQRSVSSHSLQKNSTHRVLSSVAEFFESDIGPVRRVYSTGDLQGINMVQHSCYRSESPLSNESNAIIEGMTKACRYSPEERKERIERYRSKRNLRNFNKKIKYACRKTLADSRPRIRGRFARNDELIEKNSQVQWNNIGGEEEEDEDDNWINLLDAFSSNLIP